jgi:hypothetical protein
LGHCSWFDNDFVVAERRTDEKPKRVQASGAHVQPDHLGPCFPHPRYRSIQPNPVIRPSNIALCNPPKSIASYRRLILSPIDGIFLVHRCVIMAEMASSSMNAATLAHVRTPPRDHATNRHTLSSMLLHFTEHAGIVIDAPSSFPRTRKNVKTMHLRDPLNLTALRLSTKASSFTCNQNSEGANLLHHVMLNLCGDATVQYCIHRKGRNASFERSLHLTP